MRSGRVWKCWTPLTPGGTIGSFIGLIVPNGLAIVNWKLPPEPFTMLSPVITVTVSPGANGWLGMKLPPSPSESAWIVPLWAPVLDPTTWTEPMLLAGMPRKVIWVWGSALFVFGSGYTLTGAGWATAP